jgi:ABC-type antimicrobial peptide transport system permease subunit
VGRRILVRRRPHEVIGVVRDVRTAALEGVELSVYQSLGLRSIPQVLIRDPGNRATDALAAIAGRLDPMARLTNTPLSASLDRWLRASRWGAFVAGVIGAIALSLAAVGLSGVFAYAVEQQTREIAIRMVLGARPANVLAFVLASSMRAVLIGATAGLLLAVPVSRFLQPHLYGLSPIDPTVYGSVLFVIAVTALVASYVPAQHAIRVKMADALRDQ